MSDIVGRLREDIIADAFGDGRITNGKLADRLIRERHEAADLIEQLERENAQLRRSTSFRFGIGDRVRKTKGSSWQGHVVGFYSTKLTPNGYAVESEREPGSVQIYPESALESVSSSHRLAEESGA